MNINDIKKNIKITSSTMYYESKLHSINKVLFSSHSDSNDKIFKIATTFDVRYFVPSNINIIETYNNTDENKSIAICVWENEIISSCSVYNKVLQKYTNEQTSVSYELFNQYYHSNAEEKFQLSTTLNNVQIFIFDIIEVLSEYHKIIFKTP